jgi:uncharacterized protein YqgV (UPF0045/DUF77 family)
MICCQLSFITVGDAEYNKNIEFALALIENSGLTSYTGEMSTLIKGDCDEVFLLLNKICSEMQNKNFIMNLTVSNVCGCKKAEKA